jgi:hypothetical protein
MYRVIRETQVDHTFGGKVASGWIPRHASAPPPAPERRVRLHVVIAEVEGGYILEWHGPTPHESGDDWYAELPGAEHAAEVLFAITAQDWTGAA